MNISGKGNEDNKNNNSSSISKNNKNNNYNNDLVYITMIMVQQLLDLTWFIWWVQNEMQCTGLSG